MKGGGRVTEFEKIYRDYFDDVFLYIKRLSGSEDIADDITSEAFYKAMRSIKGFRGECDIRVWLCQIAKNCYYTYLKNPLGRIASMIPFSSICLPLKETPKSRY
jgi:RNA polymerase sigma factor (sigma-70 family)